MLNTHLLLRTPEQTHAAGLWLGQICSPPLFIGLNGNLGAGKTALSQGFGKGFGVLERLISPTYNLINIYDSPKGPLFHLDIYRLRSIDEVFDLDIEDALSPPGIILMEWKNKFSDWPLNMPQLNIQLDHHKVGRMMTLVSQDLPADFADPLKGLLN